MSEDKDGFNHYSIKRKIRRGIDDLKNIYAFHGNSQGDETRTNSLDEYKGSGGWLSFVFKDIELNQAAINIESERIKKENDKYIKELEASGKYGEEYEDIVNLYIKHNPLFDQ